MAPALTMRVPLSRSALGWSAPAWGTAALMALALSGPVLVAVGAEASRQHLTPSGTIRYSDERSYKRAQSRRNSDAGGRSASGTAGSRSSAGAGDRGSSQAGDRSSSQAGERVSRPVDPRKREWTLNPNDRSIRHSTR